MNYETGLLIEGFDYPPAVGMTYNPPYYLKLIESSGYTQRERSAGFFDRRRVPAAGLDGTSC